MFYLRMSFQIDAAQSQYGYTQITWSQLLSYTHDITLLMQSTILWAALITLSGKSHSQAGFASSESLPSQVPQLPVASGLGNLTNCYPTTRKVLTVSIFVLYSQKKNLDRVSVTKTSPPPHRAIQCFTAVWLNSIEFNVKKNLVPRMPPKPSIHPSRLRSRVWIHHHKYEIHHQK